MRFVVKVEYYKFVFDNMEEASIFAQTAKIHSETKDGNTVDVSILIVDDKEDE